MRLIFRPHHSLAGIAYCGRVGQNQNAGRTGVLRPTARGQRCQTFQGAEVPHDDGESRRFVSQRSGRGTHHPAGCKTAPGHHRPCLLEIPQ